MAITNIGGEQVRDKSVESQDLTSSLHLSGSTVITGSLELSGSGALTASVVSSSADWMIYGSMGLFPSYSMAPGGPNNIKFT